MKSFAKISSHLMSKDQSLELKLENQHYIMIFPKDLIEKLGIFSDELNFKIVLDNSKKLTLVGPNISNLSKSDSINHHKEGML
ncbi:MAG: hypothetical protein MAG458_00548 [Nitrosopumilus sp.]|nr:hypothetical protein [Nitrosopumilus sp.]